MTITQNLTLTLSGPFEYQDRKHFQEAIRQVQATNHQNIILDFAQVPFIDSAALGLLVLAHQNLKLTHQNLMIVAPRENVLKVFNSVNFHKIMPIKTTEQEARKNFSSV